MFTMTLCTCVVVEKGERRGGGRGLCLVTSLCWFTQDGLIYICIYGRAKRTSDEYGWRVKSG